MAKVANQQSSHRKQNRFLVVLLAGAAVISAAKDLGRLQDLTHGLVGVASTVHQTVETALQSSPVEATCPQTAAQHDNSAQPFQWNGRVAPELIEIAGLGGNDARPAIGPVVDNELQLVAIRQSSWSDPATMSIEAPHASRVSVASRRRHEDLARVISRSVDQGTTIALRSHDQQFDFKVRVPVAYEFIRRAIADEAKAGSGDAPATGGCPTRALRIKSISQNGRVRVLTGSLPEGPQRIALAEEVNAGSAEENCAETIEVRTARGTISLDLLKMLRTSLGAESLDGDPVADLPQTLKAVIQRSMSVAPAEDEDAH